MTDSTLLAELAEALRPFAGLADEFESSLRSVNARRSEHGREPLADLKNSMPVSTQLGDCRKARAAISKYDARRLEAIRKGVGL